jgi:hypothetical protein
MEREGNRFGPLMKPDVGDESQSADAEPPNFVDGREGRDGKEEVRCQGRVMEAGNGPD